MKSTRSNPQPAAASKSKSKSPSPKGQRRPRENDSAVHQATKEISKVLTLQGETVEGFPKSLREVLISQEGNDRCVDCDSDNSELRWGCPTYGTLYCKHCAYFHSSDLEVDMTIVSLRSGFWSGFEIFSMLEGGNKNFSSYLERQGPQMQPQHRYKSTAAKNYSRKLKQKVSIVTEHMAPKIMSEKPRQQQHQKQQHQQHQPENNTEDATNAHRSDDTVSIAGRSVNSAENKSVLMRHRTTMAKQQFNMNNDPSDASVVSSRSVKSAENYDRLAQHRKNMARQFHADSSSNNNRTTLSREKSITWEDLPEQQQHHHHQQQQQHQEHRRNPRFIAAPNARANVRDDSITSMSREQSRNWRRDRDREMMERWSHSDPTIGQQQRVKGALRREPKYSVGATINNQSNHLHRVSGGPDNFAKRTVVPSMHSRGGTFTRSVSPYHNGEARFYM